MQSEYAHVLTINMQSNIRGSGATTMWQHYYLIVFIELSGPPNAQNHDLKLRQDAEAA